MKKSKTRFKKDLPASRARSEEGLNTSAIVCQLKSEKGGTLKQKEL